MSQIQSPTSFWDYSLTDLSILFLDMCYDFDLKFYDMLDMTIFYDQTFFFEIFENILDG